MSCDDEFPGRSRSHSSMYRWTQRGESLLSGLRPLVRGIIVREKRVEQTLGTEVKARGGWAIKLLPSVSGLPDRMVLLPGGRLIFVELKSPTGTVAPHQIVIHNRLRVLGFEVLVLASPAAVRDWAKGLDASRSGND